MKKLTADGLMRAARFLEEQARPVDWHLYRYHFASGSPADVLAALAAYQNEDGGFGHGVEPDLRTPASTPIATVTGLEYAREVGATTDHPVVRRAIGYLVATYRENGFWPLKLPAINDAPCADWWAYTEPERSFQANPGAAALGFLYAWRELVPEEVLAGATQQAMADLQQQPDAMEMHTMLAYLRLAAEAPEALRDRVLAKVRCGARLAITLDPAKWSGYCAKPYWFAQHPGAPLADLIAAELAANLDYEIDHQHPDGSWHPIWQWGRHPEVWARAKVEWQGHLTVRVLKVLRAFGRLDEN